MLVAGTSSTEACNLHRMAQCKADAGQLVLSNPANLHIIYTLTLKTIREDHM